MIPALFVALTLSSVSPEVAASQSHYGSRIEAIKICRAVEDNLLAGYYVAGHSVRYRFSRNEGGKPYTLRYIQEYFSDHWTTTFKPVKFFQDYEERDGWEIILTPKKKDKPK